MKFAQFSSCNTSIVYNSPSSFKLYTIFQFSVTFCLINFFCRRHCCCWFFFSSHMSCLIWNHEQERDKKKNKSPHTKQQFGIFVSWFALCHCRRVQTCGSNLKCHFMPMIYLSYHIKYTIFFFHIRASTKKEEKKNNNKFWKRAEDEL